MAFSRKICIITITIYHPYTQESTSVYFGDTINCIYGPDAEMARKLRTFDILNDLTNPGFPPDMTPLPSAVTSAAIGQI
jgi:hypothetical protein